MSELFCSKVILEIFPSARSIIAEKLMKKGMKQREISKLLGITQPAISQYKNKLRGVITQKMKENPKFMDYLNEIADEIYNNNLDINLKTCEICSLSRSYEVVKEKDFKNFLCLLEIANPN